MKSFYNLLFLLFFSFLIISCESLFLSELDECGIPGGDNSTCIDECGIPNGLGIEPGRCDCNGNVMGCDGNCGSNKVFDICGVCNGSAIYDFNCGCLNLNDLRDCLGECGGLAILDDCGVCNGDNSTCKGCMIKGSDNFSTVFTIADNESCYLNYSSIEPILSISCINCHGSSGNVNLESYSNIIDSDIVVKYDSTNSLLWQVISKNSDYYMPPNGRLSNLELKKIALWIEFGARETN